MLHRAWLYERETAVAPGDRQSLLTSGSFSASESDTFGAILNGATLCLFDVARRGLDAFRVWLEKEEITLLHPPVLLFRRFLAGLQGDKLFPRVRLVALSGDAVLPADIENWKKHFSPSCILLHRFSTTETGLLTVGRIEAEAAQEEEVPAGRAVPDKFLSLVDEHGEDVSVGETGELVVRSRFLADGYWGRAPFAQPHRTGDLGRFLPDGRFIHLGRKDHQVKIRGYRVDLRKVEAAVLQLESVREAAVVAQKENGETRMVAFVVSKPGHHFDPKILRAKLLKFVPDWEIPARFRTLAALPVTATGKLDRPRLEQFMTDRSAAAPVVTVEEHIADIWRDILNLQSVSPDDDFFDLGGHSIQALAMLDRLQQLFDVRLDPAILFENRTPAKLGALIHRNTGSICDDTIVPLRADGQKPPLFLAHSPAGDALWSIHLLPHLEPDRPIYAICPPQRAGVFGLIGSLPELAAHHARALSLFQPHGSFRLLGYSFNGRLAYETACQLAALGPHVSFLGIVDIEPVPREFTPATFLGLFVRSLPHFFKNIPYYFKDHVIRKSPAERAELFRRKMKGLFRILRALIFRSHRDYWDYQREDPTRRHLSDSQKKLWEMMVDGVRAYRPRPYAGTLDLFRPRARQLLRPIADDYGWGKLAQGGVTIHRIPGADHEAITGEAHAPVLADQINAALQNAGTD